MPREDARQLYERSETDWSTLCGKFFHSFSERNELQWQGVVEGEPRPGVYVVRVFSWTHRHPTWGWQIVSIDRMLAERWAFYPTVRELTEAYDGGSPLTNGASASGT